MMPALTTACNLPCPHGGEVQWPPGNVRALASGQPLLRMSDIGVVQGCPATNPCRQVRLLAGSQRVLAAGIPLAAANELLQYLAADGSPRGSVQVEAGQMRVLCLHGGQVQWLTGDGSLLMFLGTFRFAVVQGCPAAKPCQHVLGSFETLRILADGTSLALAVKSMWAQDAGGNVLGGLQVVASQTRVLAG